VGEGPDTLRAMDGQRSPNRILDRAARRLARSLHGEGVRDAFWVGAVDIAPNHAAFWLRVDSDACRDALDREHAERLAHQILADLGYPGEAIAAVGLAVESQETVTRDFGGNWYHAVK